MKSNKKKSNKDRDKAIAILFAEVYTVKLALKALQGQISELTPPQNPEQ